MQISIVNQKGQVIIPAKIRQKLNLQSGDKLGFECIDNKVYIKKISPVDYEYNKSLKSNLTEWNSAEDDKVYMPHSLFEQN